MEFKGYSSSIYEGNPRLLHFKTSLWDLVPPVFQVHPYSVSHLPALPLLGTAFPQPFSVPVVTSFSSRLSLQTFLTPPGPAPSFPSPQNGLPKALSA